LKGGEDGRGKKNDVKQVLINIGRGQKIKEKALKGGNMNGAVKKARGTVSSESSYTRSRSRERKEFCSAGG